MPSQRRRDPVRARRRQQDDGDDEGSVVNDVVDDSLSEGSIPSDVDDGDADDSDLSDDDVKVKAATHGLRSVKSNGSNKMKTAQVEVPASKNQPRKRSTSDPQVFEATKETEAMLNGLKISEDESKAEVMDYDTSNHEAPTEETRPTTIATKARNETIADRRRREHEEYKQKRDSDPAFIPTRGAFFMHDSRHGGADGSFRGFGRGRGRGRGGSVAPFAPAAAPSMANEPTNNPWSHDLHETLLQAPQKSNAPLNAPSGPSNASGGAVNSPRPTIARSFSTTQMLGKVQVRVLLPLMKEPVTIPDVAVKRYTKLPNHRPPLRRDKPVRLSMPDQAVRYIFPHVDRSFIFIPRAMRPNQQGFGRGRGKGVGSHGGFSSRRTSIYGGSIYSPSLAAMSRRSSIARDGMASPAGSLLSGRPVVRLPPGAQPQYPGSGTPNRPGFMSGGATPAFGIPQGPAIMVQPATYRENWPSNLQMHQPRPQKAISVTGIEYPATTYQAPIPADQFPFHHQLPAPIAGPMSDAAAAYSHSRQGSFSHPPPAIGTPLSNIPERAIHAQPFQPYQAEYGQYPGQPAYYYAAASPAAGQYAPGTVIAPMYVQSPQQGAYMMPTIAASAPPPSNQQATTPAGLVPHEQNGMVYYIDPNQVYMPAEGYAQPSYPLPPSEGYYYSQPPPNAVYYPTQ